MIIRKHIYIKGRVQGVGFRSSVLDRAYKLGLKGYVKNLPDGRVFIDAEGEINKLENLALWCKSGPSYARVDSVNTSDHPVAGYERFTVKH